MLPCHGTDTVCLSVFVSNANVISVLVVFVCKEELDNCEMYECDSLFFRSVCDKVTEGTQWCFLLKWKGVVFYEEINDTILHFLHSYIASLMFH